MRTLIRELPYERPIAGGRYRYERDGQPTGAVESWRLSRAADDYRFLRVDLNAQMARSGHSYLYHQTVGPDGRPDRLSFRFFGRGRQIRGELLFEDEHVTLTRYVDRQRLEDELQLPSGYLFWFPSTAGLSLLARLEETGARPALTLAPDEDFILCTTEISGTAKPAQTIEVMGKPIRTRPLVLTWANQERIIWLDQHRWPLRMQRDGLLAVETRYLRYGAR
ncbi:MAG TPA: hypothetical protein VK879_02530 [Candidatus Sulfomarinibacteraceae bacterium]|nr:hypothetical protein [Candidatus Sulfomarinibacteraceae bacterium]